MNGRARHPLGIVAQLEMDRAFLLLSLQLMISANRIRSKVYGLMFRLTGQGALSGFVERHVDLF